MRHLVVKLVAVGLFFVSAFVTPSQGATYTFGIGASVFSFLTNGEAGQVSSSFNFAPTLKSLGDTSCPQCGWIYDEVFLIDGLGGTRQVGQLFAQEMYATGVSGFASTFAVLPTDTRVVMTARNLGFGFRCGGAFELDCGPSGTVTINFEVSAIPLPATLPLFASGLGALALLARRRKQKQLAV